MKINLSSDSEAKGGAKVTNFDNYSQLIHQEQNTSFGKKKKIPYQHKTQLGKYNGKGHDLYLVNTK